MFEYEVYKVECGFDSFLMRIDMSQSAAPIAVHHGYERDEDGDWIWEGTRYCTADAYYDVERAARLCVRNAGEEWYQTPGGNERPQDVIVSIEVFED